MMKLEIISTKNLRLLIFASVFINILFAPSLSFIEQDNRFYVSLASLVIASIAIWALIGRGAILGQRLILMAFFVFLSVALTLIQLLV